MKLHLATGNRHKVEEFARLFADVRLEVELCSATESGGMPEVEENAPDFVGNARLKAEALRRQLPSDAWVLADDSGLEVAALGGEPGIRSARYAGENATDAANRLKLLDRLRETESTDRSARFVCVLVVLGPDGAEKCFEGICSGTIVEAEKGGGGFGYDPIFVPEGFDRTFAEVDPALKDQLSHRGKAVEAMKESWRKA